MVAPPTDRRCLEYWTCEHDPFAFPVETRHIVPTRPLRLGLARLRNAIESRVPTTIVRGVNGIGKSTLCAALREAIGEGSRCVVLSPGASTWEEIEERFAEHVPIEDDGGTSCRQRSYLGERWRVNHTVVLVDDAHTLGEDACARLIQHFEVTAGQLCLVLLTDQETLPVFDAWIGRQHELREIELVPLSEAETSYYIARRINHACSEGREIFSAEAAEVVYELSAGIPGRVDELCRHALEIGCHEAVEAIDAPLVRRAHELQSPGAALTSVTLDRGGAAEKRASDADHSSSRFATRRTTRDAPPPAGTISSLLSSIALDSPALTKPAVAASGPAHWDDRQTQDNEFLRAEESRLPGALRGVVWVGVGGCMGVAALLLLTIFLSGQGPPYAVVADTRLGAAPRPVDVADIPEEIHEAVPEEVHVTSADSDSRTVASAAKPGMSSGAQPIAAPLAPVVAVEAVPVAAEAADRDRSKLGEASSSAPRPASSNATSTPEELHRNAVIAAAVPVRTAAVPSGKGGSPGSLVAATRAPRPIAASRGAIPESLRTQPRIGVLEEVVASRQVIDTSKRELLPLDNAVQLLTQAFRNLYSIPQVQTRSIVRVKKRGERMLATLDLAWDQKNGELVTTASIQRVGAHPKCRVESRVDAEGREEIAIRRDKGDGGVEIADGAEVDPFAGTLFRFEDFRPQSPSLFEVERLESGVLDEEEVYIVTARPRVLSDYSHVEFYITTLDMTLLERRYYLDGEPSAFRTVQHPQTDLREVGGALVPTRLVVLDRDHGARVESRVKTLGLASDRDVELIALAVKPASESAVPSAESSVLPPVSMAGTSEVEKNTAPILPPAIKRVAPEYPSRALRHGLEGWVVVGFAIGKEGEVVDPEVIASEPGRQFDHAALHAIKQWKFWPVLEAGEPVEREGFRYRFAFALADGYP